MNICATRLDTLQAAQPLGSNPSVTPLIPLHQRDYDGVRFWTSASFREHEDLHSKKDKESEVGRNLRPMEDENGTSISSEECTQIRSLARAILNEVAVKNPKCLPKSWGYAGLELEQQAISELTTRFPKFRLCSGDWKVKYFLSGFYSDWKKSHMKNTAGIKEEDTASEGETTGKRKQKRKQTSTSSSKAKKARISSSSGPAEDEDDRSSFDEGHQSESEVSESQGRPKYRRKVSIIIPFAVPLVYLLSRFRTLASSRRAIPCK